MEKRRGVSLSGLFWRYLIVTGTLLAGILLLWWMLFSMLINMGLLLPASTAAGKAVELAPQLEAGTLTPGELPYYLRWAVLDEAGGVEQTNMNARHLDALREFMAGEETARIFNTQKHQQVQLPGGAVCVLQFDYSVPYADPEWQRRLPDFQTCWLTMLAVLAAAAAALSTRHYTRLLRRDAQAIVSASRAVADRQLETPVGTARVRELDGALRTIDTLRENLAASLQEQWAMEQRREEELAALTHDLKTPLTVIGGNADLLAEDALTAGQQESVAAIRRSADHALAYVGRLRALAAGAADEEAWALLEPAAFCSACRAAGGDLCAPRGVHFEAPAAALPAFRAQRETLLRAVTNLLDNAARFTPAGGTVRLTMTEQDGTLEFCVEDTGPGFSPEALAKAGTTLFTTQRARPQEGHQGLGLCQARAAAQRHGGVLLLENTPAGACARLRIPVDGIMGK